MARTHQFNSRMARLWRRLEARLRPAPIATAETLKTFLEERAALIAQKCAIDYCRGEPGNAAALFGRGPGKGAARLERHLVAAIDLFVGDALIQPLLAAEFV